MSIAPRLLAATLATLVFAPTVSLAAPVAPAPTPAPGPGPSAVQPGPAAVAPAVQRPGASAATPAPTAAPAPAPTPAPTGAQPAPGSAPVTHVPASGPDPLVPSAPTPPDLSGSDPTAPALPTDPNAPATPGLAEQLLGPSVNRHPNERAPGPVRSEEESAEQEDAAIAAMYRSLYRPPGNPGRLNVVVRGAYMIVGSVDNKLSGHMGGITADVGQSFNKIGYALTVAAHFGNLLHTRTDSQTQTIALLGGGPTINLGRLALLQRGFLDARVGYDFFVGPTRQIVEGAAIADGIRAPHGPRISLNMGLLSNPGRARKLIHGFGLTIGYQALVHSLRGEFPVANVLQLGIVYWGG